MMVSVDCESRFIQKIHLNKDSFQEAFIDGTYRIAHALEKRNFNGVFFINITEYITGSEPVKNKIEQLLKYLIDNNHQIGVHIHPSLYDGNLSPDICTYNSEQIFSMIKESCQIIEKLTKTTPTIFRSGGYCAGRWDLLYPALVKCGITTDSSVFPGASNLHLGRFDYTSFPYSWRYRPNKTDLRKTDSSGEVLELPISVAVKAKNNAEASFFRFDFNRPVWLLKLMAMYYRSHSKKHINSIYHSKEVFQENAESKGFRQLTSLLDWFPGHNGSVITYDNLPHFSQ
ncbi:MAG: hypothetical protein GC181_15355 [Bacteroidetes bacterium]|nr:hypothetical protein [Bacteroidota bacterium]